MVKISGFTEIGPRRRVSRVNRLLGEAARRTGAESAGAAANTGVVVEPALKTSFIFNFNGSVLEGVGTAKASGGPTSTRDAHGCGARASFL